MNDSERLDGDVLGEEVGDDGMPGTGDFPPDRALGVNDPNLVADDDVAMREARTRADEVGGGGRSEAGQVDDLLPPEGDDGMRDDVQQMLGSPAGDADVDDPPAEVAALHIDEGDAGRR